MKPNDPLVSIVVLNFNGEAHLNDCLDSLFTQTYRSLEIIVADNGSSDNSENLVSKYSASWVPLGKNFGFAPGNNLAFEATRGDFVIFVNNDMRFSPQFVEEMLAPLIADAGVFATDARQLDWQGNEELHLATRIGKRHSASTLADQSLPFIRMWQEPSPGPCDVVQACAANMAVRKSMFTELGRFDELLPAGWEDTEISWRAWLRGWRTVFVPSAVCYHKVGASSFVGPGSEVRFRGTLGGRLIFATKHLPAEYAVATWIVTIFGTVRALLGRRSDARARLKIIRSHISLIKLLVRERHSNYRTAGTTPRRFLRRMIELPQRPAKADPSPRTSRALLARVYAAASSRQRSVLASVPLVGGLFRQAFRRLVPAGTRTWMRVESGAGQGLELLVDPRYDVDYVEGTHESSTQNLILNLLQRGDVFYDVGAHLGFFSVIAARAVGPTGEVIAFEPDPSNAERIRANAARNRFLMVEVVDEAVWSSNAPLELVPANPSSGRSQGRVGLSINYSGAQVNGLALDQFIEGRRAPNLIKIDVEGGELEVLKGMRRLLSLHRPHVICEIHDELLLLEVSRLLETNKYQISSVGGKTGEFPIQISAIPGSEDDRR